MASEHSFGHSGFTGTYAWADPDNQSVYVFLSNRVFPDADNWKIVKKDIRTKIHQVMYEALRDKK
jgi:CubicO group peptidase (beta-lactamase class C family)